MLGDLPTVATGCRRTRPRQSPCVQCCCEYKQVPVLVPTGDLPPLILSPSQYHNYTQPKGNFIPFANEERHEYR